MTYSTNQNQLVLNQLPNNEQLPIITAFMESLLVPMSYINQNFTEYINGVTYSYYTPTASYSLGTRVIGGWYYDNYVYQCISTTWSSTNGALLSSSIGATGSGYLPGDYFSVNGGIPPAVGQVLTTHSPNGLIVNITSISSGQIIGSSLVNGGTGYSVNDKFYINGGFSLAQATVTSVSGGSVGPVVTYFLNTHGTSYTLGTASTTIFPSFSGNVLTYNIINDGYGYNIGTASTTNITGVGTGLTINNLSIGGFAPPSNTNVWEVVNNNFIGVAERDLYFNQKLTLEYALNRYFNTTFRQPNGVTMSATHSDIYISDNTFSYNTFHIGPKSSGPAGFSFRDRHGLGCPTSSLGRG